jgi:hypothetical protein
MVRNVVRDFHRREAVVKEKLKAIRQGSIGLKGHRKVLTEVEQHLTMMRRTATREQLGADGKNTLVSAIQALEKEVKNTSRRHMPAKSLKTMPAAKRRAYEQVFAWIYECSNNQTNAHLLVERILNKLG